MDNETVASRQERSADFAIPMVRHGLRISPQWSAMCTPRASQRNRASDTSPEGMRSTVAPRFWRITASSSALPKSAPLYKMPPRLASVGCQTPHRPVLARGPNLRGSALPGRRAGALPSLPVKAFGDPLRHAGVVLVPFTLLAVTLIDICQPHPANPS